MRLGISVPLWRKHSVARQALRLIRSYGTDDVLIAVGSESGKSRQLAEEEGWEYVEAPNSPLGTKRNLGLRPLRGRVDAVLILSSDDFVTPEFLDTRREQLQHREMVASKGLVFCHQQSFWWWPGYRPEYPIGPVGPGRAVRASVLDALGWQLFPERRRGLDQRAWSRGLATGASWLVDDGHRGLVNHKGDTAMNSWDATCRTGLPVQPLPSAEFTWVPSL